MEPKTLPAPVVFRRPFCVVNVLRPNNMEASSKGFLSTGHAHTAFLYCELSGAEPLRVFRWKLFHIDYR